MADIQIKNINKSYENRPVLEDFNLTVKEGTMVTIMGPSGCGKSTLAGIIMGSVQADSGSISGVPYDIGVVFQEDRLCEDMDAKVNLEMVSKKNSHSHEAEEILKELGLNDEDIHKPVSELSGGQKRRVAIARALIIKPQLMILDEAFKGLDLDTKEKAMDFIKAYKDTGITVINITHDSKEAEYLEAPIIYMKTVTAEQ